MRGELDTYEVFALGAARLAARLAQLHDEQQQEEAEPGANHTETRRRRPPLPSPPPPAWRWVERRAPLTGERVGMLELERWLPAAASEAVAAAGALSASEVGRAEEEEKDEATIAAPLSGVDGGAPYPPSPRHCYTFHAAYSRTYRAPVLCFSATRADGMPLTPEQVHRDLSPWLQMHGPGPSAAAGDSGDAATAPSRSWDFYLARGEHPAGLGASLGPSVYFLHPCRTAERMALLMERQEGGAGGGAGDSAAAAAAADRYLSAWLSAVGPAVGLARPPQPEEEVR
jgi:hypothetical protein